MKQKFILFIFLLFTGIGLSAQTIRYVKPAASGQGDGSSWENASGDLQAMINNSNANDQIWAAAGTYKPNRSAYDLSTITLNDRDNSFVLKEGVKLYGSFAGTETELAQRDLTKMDNNSILSGDLDNNDTVIKNISTTIIGNNSFHVVMGVGITKATELNGFTITGGNASLDIESDSRLNGGGIYNRRSSPLLTNLTISGNSSAADGGGMYNINNSSPILTNVILSRNTAASSGGGMCNYRSSPVLINVTISGNTAGDGGGVRNTNTSYPKLQNSIIWGNTLSDGTTINDVLNNNSLPSYQNSLVQGSGGSGTWDSTFGQNNGNNLDADPQFVDAGNGNYRLKANSPGIDRGSNNFYTDGQAPDLSSITTDLAGNIRMQKGAIDMGAYESPYHPVPLPDANGIIYVKQSGLGSFSGDSWANAAPEFADALKLAQTNKAVKQIWVAGGTYKPLYSPEDGANFGTDKGRDNTFLLVEGVKIYGGFAGTEATLEERNLALLANRTILSGDLDGDDVVTNGLSTAINGNNAFHVVIGVGLSNTTQLNGFTITGGVAGGSEFIKVGGKEVHRNGGGGILNVSSSLVLANVTISNNSALVGGGIAYLNSLSSSCVNVIINGNTAAVAGGGMIIISSSSVFTNVTITGNIANNLGGGIYNDSSSPILTNVTISGNRANRGGGTFYASTASSSSPKHQNSIIWGNTLPDGSTINNISNDVTIPIFQNSLVQGSGGSGTWDASFGKDNGNNIDEDPQFVDSSNGNYKLKSSSAALNAGDKNLYGANASTAKDLEGNARLIGANIDMGAYELQALPQVISFPDFAIVKTNAAAFELAASVDTGLPLTYASSNTAVAEVYQDPSANNQWKIRIVGDGKATITASQQGNANYESASLSRTLTVEPVTLPVSLVSYQAKMDGNRVQLSWTTSSEKDNAYFEIQRSLDGANFQRLTSVEAERNANAVQQYSVYDLNPANGANYYRLIQYDINGKAEVLGDRVVNVSIVSPVSVQAFPNPTVEEINLSFTGITAKDAQVTITDLSGRKMHQESIRLTAGRTAYRLGLYNKLAAGQYVINVVGDGLRSAIKLVVLD